nr:immunoglobulin light chain junction region [Macaca mulatta]MOV94312.1 immunoglobulin light chain junction region [Macaca mulatta]MOV94357.1 immunoglobulin light chain junction region [Macaca mulatta]MOV94433.1 immunoglobulin light chain junction region [Macaca mulatta]MOV94670.1 immunoglobulin light chain junction region [Macaca mulatta]
DYYCGSWDSSGTGLF